VVSGIGLSGSAQFTGRATTPPYSFPLAVQQSGVANTRLSAFFPAFYYARPINERFTFGFSANIPFALGSSYSDDSIVRYLSTRSRVVAFDLSPSFGAKLTKNISAGFGADAVYLTFTLNNTYGPPLSIPDSPAHNSLSGWGYGWHAGLLYEPLPTTRIGASFNSMVTIQTTGESVVYQPFLPSRFKIENNKTKSALPARAQLSLQHDINTRWTAMATIFYTNWRTFEKITMRRVLVPGGGTTSVTIPFNYHNSFDYSAGATFKATEKWLLRAGLQYMNTPSNDQDRGVADPVGRAWVVGIGAHYQQNPCIAYDIGAGHSFFKQESVNVANALTSANGHTNSQSTVFGGQVTWNL
jgi:long-chain fatty acid transport protein